jgi:hypothetical protein
MFNLPKISDTNTHQQNVDVCDQIKSIIQKMSESEREAKLDEIIPQLPNRDQIDVSTPNWSVSENYHLINTFWEIWMSKIDDPNHPIFKKCEEACYIKFDDISQLHPFLLPKPAKRFSDLPYKL